MALTTISPALQNTQAQYTGFKNRIINGAMMIDQRNAGASVSVASPATIYYSVDRFNVRIDSATGSTTQQSTLAPAGFSNSDLITIGTGASPAASAYNYFGQRVEGYNIADLNWGTANASPITVSFWVYSSVTGTFGISARNSAADRSYVSTYTISSANTWEYKTVTIQGDTSGTWLTNNGVGIFLFFDLGQGSNVTTNSINSWLAGNYAGYTSGTKLCATTGATIRFTGVQLEKGSTATSFDYRPYGTELALCQRYAWVTEGSTMISGVVASQSLGYIAGNFAYPVQMRAAPSVGINTSGSYVVSNSVSADYTASTFAIWNSNMNTQSARISLSGFSGLPATSTLLFGIPSQGTGKLILSAEL